MGCNRIDDSECSTECEDCLDWDGKYDDEEDEL